MVAAASGSTTFRFHICLSAVKYDEVFVLLDFVSFFVIFAESCTREVDRPSVLMDES
jgi:hypothetical protein